MPTCVWWVIKCKINEYCSFQLFSFYKWSQKRCDVSDFNTMYIFSEGPWYVLWSHMFYSQLGSCILFKIPLESFLSTFSNALFQLFGQQQTFTQSLLGSGQQNFSQINSQLNAQASDTNDMNAESSNQLNSGNQYNTLTNQVNSQVAAQLNTQIGGFNQNQFSMQVTLASFSYCSTI